MIQATWLMLARLFQNISGQIKQNKTKQNKTKQNNIYMLKFVGSNVYAAENERNIKFLQSSLKFIDVRIRNYFNEYNQPSYAYVKNVKMRKEMIIKKKNNKKPKIIIIIIIISRNSLCPHTIMIYKVLSTILCSSIESLHLNFFMYMHGLLTAHNWQYETKYSSHATAMKYKG